MFRVDIEKSGLLSELDSCPKGTVVRKCITFLNCFSLNICIGIIYSMVKGGHVTGHESRDLINKLNASCRVAEERYLAAYSSCSLWFQTPIQKRLQRRSIVQLPRKATPCCSSLKLKLYICTVFRKDRGLIAKEKEIGTSTNCLLGSTT